MNSPRIAHNRHASAGNAPEASPPQRKGDQSSDRLLEIAAVLFREKGYTSTTMRDIAVAAGMKAGSLYYHFASKDHILDLVLERGISATIANVRSALEAVPPDACFADRLRAAIAAHLQSLVDFGIYTQASRQLLNQAPDAIRKKHLSMRKTYDAVWRSLMDDARARGQLRPGLDYGLVRLFLLGSINWTSEWAGAKSKSVTELSELATDLFLNGIAK